MNVILLGMKHCGKSTLGAALAERRGCPFFDTDALIEETYERDAGRRLTVREIYATLGDAAFNDLDARVVGQLHATLTRPGSSAVVAVGGRTALHPDAPRRLRAMGTIVYLQVAPDELFARVLRNGLPPFLGKDDPAGDFHALYRQRAPHYERLADVTVNLDGLDIEASVRRLVETLEGHTDGG